ncbi:hypothetical protein [Geodermatophilus sp. SYSU D01176]
MHISDRTPRPPRDGAVRHAYAPRIDGQNRVNLGKALGALGWTRQTLLVAARENGHVVIRAAADSPLLTRVPVDADRRLTLPPAVLVTLDVRPGDQVLAGVVVDAGELHLFPVADPLQLLTGALPSEVEAGGVPESAPAPRAAGGSRVRGRWMAEAVAVAFTTRTRTELAAEGRLRASSRHAGCASCRRTSAPLRTASRCRRPTGYPSRPAPIWARMRAATANTR